MSLQADPQLIGDQAVVPLGGFIRDIEAQVAEPEVGGQVAEGHLLRTAAGTETVDAPATVDGAAQAEAHVPQAQVDEVPRRQHKRAEIELHRRLRQLQRLTAFGGCDGHVAHDEQRTGRSPEAFQRGEAHRTCAIAR